MSDKPLPQAKKARTARKSCLGCRKAHAACDSSRPCFRCKQKNIICEDPKDSTELTFTNYMPKGKTLSPQNLSPTSQSLQLTVSSSQSLQQIPSPQSVQQIHSSQLVQPVPPLQSLQQIPSPQPVQQIHSSQPVQLLSPLQSIQPVPSLQYVQLVPPLQQQTPVLQHSLHNTSPATAPLQPPSSSPPSSSPPLSVTPVVTRPFPQLTGAEKEVMDQAAANILLHFGSQINAQMQSVVDPLSRGGVDNALIGKIDGLFKLIQQQQSMIEQLLKNIFVPQLPQCNNQQITKKWSQLLSVQEVQIAIRDRKTFQLLAYNQAFAAYLQKFKQQVRNVHTLHQILDSFLIMMLLTLLRENGENTDFTIANLKLLISWSDESFVLLRCTAHFDDPEVFWVESVILDPPIMDDQFTLGDYFHPPTVSICLPANDAKAARALYEPINRERFNMLISCLLTHKSKQQILQRQSPLVADNPSI